LQDAGPPQSHSCFTSCAHTTATPSIQQPLGFSNRSKPQCRFQASDRQALLRTARSGRKRSSLRAPRPARGCQSYLVPPMSSAQATTRDTAWGTMPRMSCPPPQPAIQPAHPLHIDPRDGGCGAPPSQAPDSTPRNPLSYNWRPESCFHLPLPGVAFDRAPIEPRAAPSGVCLDLAAARRLAVRVMGDDWPQPQIARGTAKNGSRAPTVVIGIIGSASFPLGR
jgi:hypothetical protein